MAGKPSLFLSLFLVVLLTPFSELSRAAAVDAQEACVGPVQDFASGLDDTNVDQTQRDEFLGLIRACSQVYLHELRQVERHYDDLPEGSHCRELGEEFRDTLQTLERIERTAAELPLATAEDQQAALAFYRLAAPGLSRAVNGLFILHYGICREEAGAPLGPSPSSNATISTPDEGLGRL